MTAVGGDSDHGRVRLQSAELLDELNAIDTGHPDIGDDQIKGLSHDLVMLWEVPPDQVQEIVDTNITGVINGSRTAVIRMQRQGHGAIYNMEGFGSEGRVRPGLSIFCSAVSGLPNSGHGSTLFTSLYSSSLFLFFSVLSVSPW